VRRARFAFPAVVALLALLLADPESAAWARPPGSGPTEVARRPAACVQPGCAFLPLVGLGWDALANPQPVFQDPGDARRHNDSCATAFPIGFNPIFATIYRSQDVDYYITDPMSAGEYEIDMEPPNDRDYDLELLNAVNASRNLCSSTGIVLNSAGDHPEHTTFGVGEGYQVVFVVYPATVADVDAVNPYRIQLSRVTPGPSEPRPTPVDASPTPTITVPEPTP
jgi:hypothetical protein